MDAQAATDPAPLAHNSQTIQLPEPAISMAGGLLAQGGGNITVEKGALVSDAGPLGTQADDTDDRASSDAVSLYVVKKGDTLSGIAKMFDVTVGTIRLANDMPVGASVREGSTLLILPITGMQYVIKKGDTLAKIAKKTGGDAEEIGKFNGLEADSQLTVGDTIIIPDAELAAPVQTTTKKPATTSGTKGNLPKVAYGVTALKAGSANGPEYAGYYVCPVSGIQTQGLHGNNGRDFGAANGTPVYAAAGGTVIVASGNGKWNYGYGNYIIVSHANGTQTLYGHLSKVLVSVGESVSKGENIGRVGNTGRSTGSHLHFEVRGAQNDACGR